jgi:hypothetical protein
VQATAANAVTVAAPATFLVASPFAFRDAAQPQPGDVSDGSAQDGSITFM